MMCYKKKKKNKELANLRGDVVWNTSDDYGNLKFWNTDCKAII